MLVCFAAERRVLKESDYPLLERVLLGPIEDEAKIFIMEKDKTHEVSSEVRFAQICDLKSIFVRTLTPQVWKI